MSEGYGIREILAATAEAAVPGAMTGIGAERRSDKRLTGRAFEAAKAARQRADAALSPVVVGSGLRALDAALVALTGLVLLVYVEPPILWGYYLPLIGFTAALTLGLFQLGGLYEIGLVRTVTRHVGRVALGWSLAVVLAVVMIFLFKLGDAFSRGWWLLWFVAGLMALMAARLVVRSRVAALIAQGRLTRRAVVVGGGKAAEDFIQALEASRDHDLEIVGVFDDRDETRVAPVEGHPRLGDLEDLITFSRLAKVDMLIVTIPYSAEARLLAMLKKLSVLPVDVRLSAHANKLRFRPRSYSYVGNVPMLDVLDRPLTDWDKLQKAAFDRVLGGLVLLALTPVMALIALCVKLDSPGPALFRQKRYGFNNEMIEVFKFRSMYVDQSDAKADRMVTREDPRVTRVGRFIRRTSLDELPQLINVVLKGDLSLVGPRPHAVGSKAGDRLYGQVVDSYFARHKVKPGITGWAQINGWRGETDTSEKIEKRVEHDLYYIENWSVPFDLRILVRTPLSLVTTDNAY